MAGVTRRACDISTWRRASKTAGCNASDHASGCEPAPDQPVQQTKMGWDRHTRIHNGGPVSLHLGEPYGRDGGQSGRPERQDGPYPSARAAQRKVVLNLTSQGYRAAPLPPELRPAPAPQAFGSSLGLLLGLLVFRLLGGLVISAGLLAVVLASVGEAGIAKPGAAREHAPAIDILHERHLG